MEQRRLCLLISKADWESRLYPYSRTWGEKEAGERCGNRRGS